jgi:hypothetical protein
MALFAATLAVGGFLLGMLVPIWAKVLFPRFAGAEQVLIAWLLLTNFAAFLGFIYAHMTAMLALKLQLIVHALFLLLGAACLLPRPFDVASWTSPAENNPLPALLLVFAVLFALPCVMVTATGPLVQSWFGHTSHPAALDPYFLYGVNLMGECAGIIAYAWLIEPYMRLASQGWLWTAGYGLLALMTTACAACMLLFPRPEQPFPADPGRLEEPSPSVAIPATPLRKPTLLTRLCWFGLPPRRRRRTPASLGPGPLADPAGDMRVHHQPGHGLDDRTEPRRVFRYHLRVLRLRGHDAPARGASHGVLLVHRGGAVAGVAVAVDE